MRSPKPSGRNRSQRVSGFSLLEMTIVIAIVIITTVVSFISLVPALNNQRVVNAYNTTLAAMRQARDQAISQRTSYSVTFSNLVTPNTITVAWVPTAGETTLSNGSVPFTLTYQLPTGVTFYAFSVFASTPPPDGYGAGTNAIDFGYTANGVGTGGQSTIYFCPDGSAQDAEGGSGNCAGSWDGGVVYLAQSGNLLSSRAVDVWGATGRIHGWRLYSNGSGGYQWVRQ